MCRTPVSPSSPEMHIHGLAVNIEPPSFLLGMINIWYGITVKQNKKTMWLEQVVQEQMQIQLKQNNKYPLYYILRQKYHPLGLISDSQGVKEKALKAYFGQTDRSVPMESSDVKTGPTMAPKAACLSKEK